MRYEQAVMKPPEQSDEVTAMTLRGVNVAEVHDLFPAIEPISYEDVRIRRTVRGVHIVEAGIMSIGGGLSVNARWGTHNRKAPAGSSTKLVARSLHGNAMSTAMSGEGPVADGR